MEGSKGQISSTRHDEPEFDLREWHLKARISRDNTNSRRFSASYVVSAIKEDNYNRSFRSNFTISSTVSSPGYHLRDEIDPSTYSFTTALKALQGKSGYVWECLSPEGFALNSKWDEAERYICNPLSGQVPMECLSAKTLSGRSFHNMVSSRITMSAPVVYSAKPRPYNKPKPPVLIDKHTKNKILPEPAEDHKHPVSTKTITDQQVESQDGSSKTRDVGTQISPPDDDHHHQSSPSRANLAVSTPSVKQRKILRQSDDDEDGDVSSSSTNMKSLLDQVKMEENDQKRKEDGPEDTTENSNSSNNKIRKVKTDHFCKCRHSTDGCLFSLENLRMRKRQKEKPKPRRRRRMVEIFVPHCLRITDW